MKKLFDPNKDYSGILSSIVAIVIGLLVGFIVLLVLKPSKAVEAFGLLITGGFYSGLKTFGNVLYYATPLIICGLGTGVAFKASIFNIGGPGQMHMGAFVAIYTAVKWNLPGPLGWLVPLIMSMVAGALWALIPALLYAYKKVNVIILTIMMNYIGLYLANRLIVLNIFDSAKNQTRAVPMAHKLPTLGFDKIFRGSVVNCGFVIAIALAIVFYIILEKTTFGYEIKACGKNRDAADYAGINARKTIVVTMLISGALIGLAGATMYLSNAGKYLKVEDNTLPEGFQGLAVTLLAQNNPIGIIFSGIFLAYLETSGSFVQGLGFSSEIVDVISAVIIYCSALSLLISEFMRKRRLNRLTGVDRKKVHGGDK